MPQPTKKDPAEAYGDAEQRIAKAAREHATELDLSRLGLTSVPPEIGLLTALKKLILYKNRLTALPPEMWSLTALNSLSLWDNEFTSLPPEIESLTALKAFILSSNRLTSLPPQIGRCKQLEAIDVRFNDLESLPELLGELPQLLRLMVHGNPLPDELLKLSGGINGDGAQLIHFLRARAEARAGAAVSPLKRFDEAKLLLVGPGAVGKTWLLRALQGKVPEPTLSTKGIEIAREPLDVPHPSEPERTLHLTCWDFGGQDHYQVTHQIFFSAKAVYLLVWKPREGFDPEMAARLERIQLSAGRTAKVLIVSTHADGNVPAVLGQDALRERFGDLIGGFYQVDSGKGPEGTGIAVLKDEIARAAAQLQGMDLDFPANWHAAQQAIRKIKQPAVPFKRLAEVCGQHGLDVQTADTLAQLMEVQGHAVYFPDAAEDVEAGSMADQNLVVLKPEWLAKAVGFVIEDKSTIADQGILQHERLAQIWKKDAQRDCPGYKRELRGFLLWLMWKFDIAYKQDGQTSLVPELIARNRPDDLLWRPGTEAQSREARAVCVFASEQSGKQIAAPKGMLPALTAAVHPLRPPRGLTNPDRLDRNWNNGFFLHTQSRGDAYVELLDRELQLIVRHEYPSLLLAQVQKTLEELVPQRWPHVRLDLRVPCPGTINAKPCPGTFKKDWLENQRDKAVACQDCGHDDFEAKKLLEGFDPRAEEVMQRLRQLNDGQQELLDGQRGLLAAAHSIFLALDPENEERKRGPSLFTILPEQKGWIRGMGFDHVRLTCWCEHPDGPHPGSPIRSNEPPDYVLQTPKEWLIRSAPYISWAVALLKAFTPLAVNVAGQAIGGLPGMDLKDTLALMKDMAGALPAGKLEIGESRDFELEPGKRFGGSVKAFSRPELVALRHIHDILEEQVAKPKRWGSLSPVRTKSGEILWLCPAHKAIQEPPPQKI